ncbi:MAG: metal ABC transporter permease [Clostridia bacterium]|nr:metal ABC transporter permease [Clostridia bacterium]
MAKIIFYFQNFPTIRYATLALLLISLCAALLGVTLVLKRFSMIGDGLSHVTFGAAAIATAMGLVTPIYVSLPITVLAAVLLLKIRSNTKIQGDAAIAMVSAGSLAFGYLIMNLFPGKSSSISGDACTNLFGQGILGINKQDVAICAILSALVLFIFIFFYNKIFAITFDESFSRATGTRAEVYNTLIAVITGVIIVVSMNMVGALLISALITFPALSAMRVFKTFRSVIICASVISIACAIIGVLVSLAVKTPVGSTIVVADVAAFGLFSLIGAILKRN